MCGFVGFTGGGMDSATLIDSMIDAIRHRGPDSQNSYVDDGIAMGFARLSIIDLSGSVQPMSNEDGTKIITFNGEIYNYQELREDLIQKGHIFRTHGDTETILHGYEEYGAGILNKLRGMFAFVIWDKKEQKLFGARDFFGIKPFYYATMNGRFFYGSEIKGFLPHPDFVKEFNRDKLPDYMTFGCVPGYDTFFKNVWKLKPGHYLEYQQGELKIEKYFEVTFDMDPDKTMEYYVEEIKKTFEDSVHAHKVSDVEVGCFLSSGVDSSYVASELSRVQKLRTYTIGFDDKRYSEDEGAKMVSDELGVENYLKIVSDEEYLNNASLVQYHLDEPLANPSANLLFFVSQRAAEDLKVVLSGEGADEMFGGYNVYKEPLDLASYQKLPLPLRKGLAGIAKVLPRFKGKNFLIRGSLPIEERYIGNSNIFPYGERESYLKGSYVSHRPQTYTKPFYDKVKNLDDITKMQYMDMHVWMVQEILLKADKMSMAHSLELRVPFLDKEIFALARRIPTKYKVSKENTKLALRQAARTRMNEISANRRKMAFPLPLPEWLKEDLYYDTIKEAFTGPIGREFFETGKILTLLEEHRAGRFNHSRRIWAVYTFILWYQVFFGSEGIAAKESSQKGKELSHE